MVNCTKQNTKGQRGKVSSTAAAAAAASIVRKVNGLQRGEIRGTDLKAQVAEDMDHCGRRR